MPKKLTESQCQIWVDRLIRSAKIREEEREKWELMREYYKGNYGVGAVPMDTISVNYMLSNVRQMGAVLYGQQPRMYFRPKGYMSSVAAYVAEQVVDEERRVMEAEFEERACVHNGLMYGTGILKHGYSYEYGPELPTGSKVTQKMKNEVNDADMPQGVFVEHDDRYNYGHPWVRSIHPRNFFPDPDALSVPECRWMACRYLRPYLDVIRDTRFPESQRKKVTPSGRTSVNGSLDLIEGDWEDEKLYTDTEMVSVIEIYDKPTQQLIVITDAGVCLLQEDYPFLGPMGPFEILQFFPRDDSFWGIPWSWTFAPQVEALNKLRTHAFDHLQRYGQIKGVYDRGTLREEQVAQWADSPSGAMLPLDLRNRSKITDLIQFMPYVEIAADSYRLVDQFQYDMDQISGISELSRGSGKSIQTATEAAYMQQQGESRTQYMRTILDRFLRRSTKRIVSLLKQFWGAERVISLVGPDGQIWNNLSVPYDVITTPFDVDIEPGSTERIDKNVRIRQIIDAMQTLTPMVPYLQAAGHDLNWPEVVKDYLKATDVVRNPSRWLVQLPPPQPGASPQLGAESVSPQVTGAQLPPPTEINNMGEMPWDRDAGAYGRVFSEQGTGNTMVGV